jgi:hypothetical protein
LHAPHHLGFAFGLIDDAVLEMADFLGQARALVEQAENLIVDTRRSGCAGKGVCRSSWRHSSGR